MDIREMKAGRELDALVAEIVMDGCWTIDDETVFIWEKEGGASTIFSPSTDMTAAWKVRKWLLDNRGGVRLERFCDAETPEYCEVYRGKECKLIQVWATTTPEAICKAALLVMEDEQCL